ncbi:MAG: L,D-transpeptidase [Microbacteriaceae bacterium]|nr:L,D-transpeptidase [Microbacteriaceae bacterium]
MRQKVVLMVGTAAIFVSVASAWVLAAPGELGISQGPPTASTQGQGVAPTSPAAPLYTDPPAAAIAAAPEARYDAVIPGLIPYLSDAPPSASSTAFELIADTAVYGADRSTLVARLNAKNFLDQPTIVVPVQIDPEWALIMTPARNALPSANNNLAAAQTVGWVRSAALTHPTVLLNRVVISATERTLTILNERGAAISSFPVGVGTPETPSPTGVTGYLQARYLDPAQGQSTYPIQLTSMHSAVADNPYGGTDGGLIGIHFEKVNSGAVSHGCIRVPIPAIEAVNQLPLGTTVTILK